MADPYSSESTSAVKQSTKNTSATTPSPTTTSAPAAAGSTQPSSGDTIRRLDGTTTSLSSYLDERKAAPATRTTNPTLTRGLSTPNAGDTQSRYASPLGGDQQQQQQQRMSAMDEARAQREALVGSGVMSKTVGADGRVAYTIGSSPEAPKPAPTTTPTNQPQGLIPLPPVPPAPASKPAQPTKLTQQNLLDARRDALRESLDATSPLSYDKAMSYKPPSTGERVQNEMDMQDSPQYQSEPGWMTRFSRSFSAQPSSVENATAVASGMTPAEVKSVYDSRYNGGQAFPMKPAEGFTQKSAEWLGRTAAQVLDPGAWLAAATGGTSLAGTAVAGAAFGGIRDALDQKASTGSVSDMGRLATNTVVGGVASGVGGAAGTAVANHMPANPTMGSFIGQAVTKPVVSTGASTGTETAGNTAVEVAQRVYRSPLGS